MTRDTSAEAYRIIKEKGILSKVRFQVYDYLYHHGPCTMRQVCHALAVKKERSATYTPRFAELKRMQAIQEVGKTICEHTERQVYQWDVTSKIPVDIKKSKKQKLIELIARLEKNLAEAKHKLRLIQAKEVEDLERNQMDLPFQ